MTELMKLADMDGQVAMSGHYGCTPNSQKCIGGTEKQKTWKYDNQTSTDETHDYWMQNAPCNSRIDTTEEKVS